MLICGIEVFTKDEIAEFKKQRQLKEDQWIEVACTLDDYPGDAALASLLVQIEAEIEDLKSRELRILPKSCSSKRQPYDWWRGLPAWSHYSAIPNAVCGLSRRSGIRLLRDVVRFIISNMNDPQGQFSRDIDNHIFDEVNKALPKSDLPRLLWNNLVEERESVEWKLNRLEERIVEAEDCHYPMGEIDPLWCDDPGWYHPYRQASIEINRCLRDIGAFSEQQSDRLAELIMRAKTAFDFNPPGLPWQLRSKFDLPIRA